MHWHGSDVRFRPELLLLNLQLSLRQGALAVYNGGPFKERHRDRLLASAAALRLDLDSPLATLRQRQRQALLHCGGSQRTGSFEGVIPHCRRLLESSSRESVRSYLAQFMNEVSVRHVREHVYNPRRGRSVSLGRRSATWWGCRLMLPSFAYKG